MFAIQAFCTVNDEPRLFFIHFRCFEYLYLFFMIFLSSTLFIISRETFWKWNFFIRMAKNKKHCCNARFIAKFWAEMCKTVAAPVYDMIVWEKVCNFIFLFQKLFLKWWISKYMYHHQNVSSIFFVFQGTTLYSNPWEYR